MKNPMKSEVCLSLDGKPTILRMNLGALAALEDALGEKNLEGLISRFSQSSPSAGDLILVLNAGLYGAGETPNIEARSIDGGAINAAQAAAELLARAFPKVAHSDAI